MSEELTGCYNTVTGDWCEDERLCGTSPNFDPDFMLKTMLGITASMAGHLIDYAAAKAAHHASLKNERMKSHE